MKRRAWIALFVATAITVSCVGYRYAHRNEVPVGQTWAWRLTTDETPVKTELYEYKLPNGSQSGYTITGRKASFLFPAAYYFYWDNQDGGPQSILGISIDKDIYRPVSLLIKEKYKINSNLLSKYRPEFSDQDLVLHIETNAVPLSVFSVKKIYSINLEAGKLIRAGKVCGFDMAYRTGSPDIIYPRGLPQVRVEGVDLMKSDISGFKETSNELHEISCGYSARICIIKFPFHWMQVGFKLKKENICESDNQIKQIKDILSA